MGEHKSYSQKKREEYPYRDEYFKRNPGYFGCIWVCSQCGRPLLGRKSVHVDHIVPLNNPLGINRSFNLVAICERCNREKSDIVDGRVLRGYMAKIIETVLFTFQKIVLVVLVCIWVLLRSIFHLLLSTLRSPFINTTIKTKIIAILFYGIFVLMIYSKLK